MVLRVYKMQIMNFITHISEYNIPFSLKTLLLNNQEVLFIKSKFFKSILFVFENKLIYHADFTYLSKINEYYEIINCMHCYVW